jgi:hypothetical protein
VRGSVGVERQATAPGSACALFHPSGDTYNAHSIHTWYQLAQEQLPAGDRLLPFARTCIPRESRIVYAAQLRPGRVGACTSLRLLLATRCSLLYISYFRLNCVTGLLRRALSYLGRASALLYAPLLLPLDLLFSNLDAASTHTMHAPTPALTWRRDATTTLQVLCLL